MRPDRLALIGNFRLEASPSMLVCGDQLHSGLLHHHPEWSTELIQPAYRRVFSRLPRLPLLHRLTTGADKMLNRYGVYPWHLSSRRRDFDCHHICDHSYASLVHRLPAERTGVLCHDVDVFRSVLQPELYRRSPRFNTMQRYALAGLARAAVVFYTTNHVRDEILRYGLTREQRLVQVPLGIHPSFLERPPLDQVDALVKRTAGDRPFLLNVSVTLPRKRLDDLLRCFALLRRRHPDLLLVRVGPEWTPDQDDLIADLNLDDGIRRIARLDQSALAPFYRAARAVLMTSEAEGFGMPLIEALASGALAVVSDIPVFHEVAGDAALYCPVGDPVAWAALLTRILEGQAEVPDLATRLASVQRFSWQAHAQVIASAYRERILEPLGQVPGGAAA